MRVLSLDGAWTLKTDAGESFDARVPGTLLSTLLENGAIADPFDGQNERIALEILKKPCAFERSFEADAPLLCAANVDLVFEGLDTLASIELNGELLGQVDNMHRTWRFPARERLRVGENTIRVSFASAAVAAQEAALANPDISYVNSNGTRGSSLIRKAHYMYGWDWGPQLPDMGIWRPARLEAYDWRIDDVRVEQEHHEGCVTLTARVRTGAPQARLTLYAPDGAMLGENTAPAGEPLRIRVDDPLLWWPNGLGEHPLYSVRIDALGGGAVHDTKTLRVGLRTLGVSIRPDAYGESFELCCNGVSFFAMGADYIPQDNLLTRVTVEETRRLLEDCVRANFNCLRVWGGGVYPDDSFFDLCDELGIVLWQDLMFACNVYKMTNAFEKSIVCEVRDNLRRIRHHACIGLICGNNEMEIAWVEWENVAKRHSPALKADYLKQFEFVLERVCREEAPELFYWPSSPSSGGSFDDPGDMNRGDVHDWSIWHGGEPFENYAKRYPRFCSEFGFESFPDVRTLQRFIHSDEDMNPFSPVMEAHQKCLSGNARMLLYLAQQLRYPFSMEQLIADTQYIQAEAMRTGVEHWRRNRGRCMGAIYWQLNDCWPVASWASIDSENRWKALHFAAKRFFAPVLISVERIGMRCRFVLSCEQREAFAGKLVWRLRDARGNVLEQGEADVSCAAMSAQTVLERDFDGPQNDRVLQFYVCDQERRRVSEGIELFDAPKNLLLGEPALSYQLAHTAEGTQITLSSDCLAIGVCIACDDCGLSDNWFALYPDEQRIVTADKRLDDIALRSIR